MNKKLMALLKLLADEDQTVANFAMAETLSSVKNPGELISRLQESSLKNIRRKSHQMQGVVNCRNERSNLFVKIQKNPEKLIENLIEIHQLWFNEDTKEELLNEWEKIFDRFNPGKQSSLKKILSFMKNNGFRTSPFNELFAEYFCIGSVFGKKLGSDCILAAISSELANKTGIETNVIKTEAGFGISCDMKKICLPSANWAVVSNSPDLKSSIFTPLMICRYAAYMLLLCAIISGSFRYVNTIGTALLDGNMKKTIFDIFPYPYGKNQI